MSASVVAATIAVVLRTAVVAAPWTCSPTGCQPPVMVVVVVVVTEAAVTSMVRTDVASVAVIKSTK